MAIKENLGKLVINASLKDLFHATQREGFNILDISFEHIYTVNTFPFVHRDPFDRLLVSQAKAENMALLSRDTLLARYGITVYW